ncbi:MAG: hypothetical protein ABI629_11455 [bacterium]
MPHDVAAGARRRDAGILAIGLIAIAVCYGPTLLAHVQRGVVRGVVNDDAREWIAPFVRGPNGSPFHGDLLQDYAAALTPPGVWVFYTLAARVADPLFVSSVLQYALYGLFLVAMGSAAARFGGVLAGLAAVALCLSGEIFLDRIAGGLARSFGFPILACGLAALLHGRLRWLAAVVAVGALFYAPPALLLGVTLALVALVAPQRWRGDLAAWSWPRRLLLVGATAFVGGLGQLPTAIAAVPYGARLAPADVADYSEVGPQGRFSREDAFPTQPYSVAVADDVARFLYGSSDRDRQAPQAALAAIAALAALLLLGRREPAALRLVVFVLVAVAGYQAAVQCAPWLYLPQRYVRYPLPVAFVLVVVAVPSLLVRRARNPTLPALLAAAGLALWMGFGPHGSATAGLNTATQRTPLLDYLAALPEDVLIAGWPSAMDGVPLLAHRSAFLTQENALAFQRGYVEQTRVRMGALIAAYFATDAAPLRALHEQFGVTHLVFDTRHYDGPPPLSYLPFTPLIAEQMRDKRPGDYLLPQLRELAVFSDGTVAVLDLR